jgi:hypothetical protein
MFLQAGRKPAFLFSKTVTHRQACPELVEGTSKRQEEQERFSNHQARQDRQEKQNDN